MSLENLISKILAAGLAAGIFLLWWPAHLPTSGMEWLVLRGVLWTLVFEVLVVSFCPVEQMATKALVTRRAAHRAREMRGRLAAATPAPARTGGIVFLALVALAVPVFMLANAGSPPAAKAAAPVAAKTVVRKVVVRKVVRQKTVVVRTAAPVVTTRVVEAAPKTPAATATPKAAAKAKATTPVKPTTSAKTTATADPATQAAPADPAASATEAADAPVPAG